MNTDKKTRPWRRVCMTLVAAGGLSLSTLGLAASTAQAAPPAPAPTYHHHWCPGDRWDPDWGPNGNWGNCRDWDDNFGPAGWGGPPAWAAPQPPPPFWAPWAPVVWNADFGGWGFWNAGVWVPL